MCTGQYYPSVGAILCGVTAVGKVVAFRQNYNNE